MRFSWRWIDVLGYIRTASALHSYHEKHPEDLERPNDTRFLEQDLADVESFNDSLQNQSGAGSLTMLDSSFVEGGDIAMRFWKDMRQRAQLELSESATGETAVKKGVDSGVGLLDRVTVEWAVALLLTRSTA
jgi:hypothetical protein